MKKQIIILIFTALFSFKYLHCMKMESCEKNLTTDQSCKTQSIHYLDEKLFIQKLYKNVKKFYLHNFNKPDIIILKNDSIAIIHNTFAIAHNKQNIIDIYREMGCCPILSYEINTPAHLNFLYNETLLVANTHAVTIIEKLKIYNYGNPIEKCFVSPQQTIPLVTTHPTKYAYVYHNKNNNEIIINDMSTKHNSFILFALRHYLEYLPSDIVREIIRKVHECTWTHRVKIENNDIKDMIYSPNGHYLALVYDDQTIIYNTTDIENHQTNYTIIPRTVFIAFHPNNKTIMALERNYYRMRLYAYDLQTKKLIAYGDMRQKDPALAFVSLKTYDGFYKKIAIDPTGKTLTIAFENEIATFTIPEHLQEFFNTYDPEAVTDILKGGIIIKNCDDYFPRL